MARPRPSLAVQRREPPAKAAAILETIDWDALSPRALEIAVTFAPLISREQSIADVAMYFGRSPAWAAEQVRFLRRELEAQLARQPE